jgi:putative redox protein
MDSVIEVGHKGGDVFEINIRGHLLYVDQPVEDGGGDAGPTPTELFVASVGSCVAFYVRRFLARHDLPTDDLEVSASYTMADRPARVGAIRVTVSVPRGVPRERHAALLAVARRCTVHNSLEQPPSVSIELAA